jgi:lysyl-tRNA synthetase class 2
MKDPSQIQEQNMGPEQPAKDENRLVRERYDKADRMREAGIDLFVNRHVATHNAAEIIGKQESLLESGARVAVSGRVMVIRSFGKAGFFNLRDDSGDIQVYVKRDVTNEPGFELFKKWLDGGDVVGVSGRMFITRHGELTIEAAELRLLTKSMRALPEKWHGFKDIELRYRQRYVDMIVNAGVRETFKTRSRIISSMRQWLDERAYIEVETPMMQPVYGGAAARPFVTHHNTLDMQLYLRIAPELYLKRLLVGGFERVYEINRNFRNEGISIKHNPEFTMLELYTVGFDYRDTMELTENLIHDTATSVFDKHVFEYGGNTIDLATPFRRLKIVDAVAETLGLDNAHGLCWGMADKEKLGQALGISTADNPTVRRALDECATPDEVLICIFEELVEASLVQPTFIIEYPASLSPLSKCCPEDPPTAERFELYMAGMELANAFSELNDPADQLGRFESQVRRKAQGDEEAMCEVDSDYIRCLEYGMPPASGLGIGIDRLVMLLTGNASIRDVILFPQMRPE